MHRSILSVISSDLPGVNPTTLNGMILYYRLMTKWSGLGDSTELSRMELSQGATTGGSPLNGPIFHKTFTLKKTLSTSQPGILGRKRQCASNQRAETGEPGTAHASSRIRSPPSPKICLSDGKGMEQQKQNETNSAQYTRFLRQIILLHKPHDMNPNYDLTVERPAAFKAQGVRRGERLGRGPPRSRQQEQRR
jgi:hypothetical protein